jgi:hypothetical protein
MELSIGFVGVGRLREQLRSAGASILDTLSAESLLRTIAEARQDVDARRRRNSS